MCTGFTLSGGVDAWAYKGLGQDIPNCAYYLNKKLPIVAYATVQMQSNAIQVASGTTPTSPTTPTTPTTPANPIAPFPEPPTTPVAPVAPVTPAPVTPPPSEPTNPDQPPSCNIASSSAVTMGPMSQQQLQAKEADALKSMGVAPRAGYEMQAAAALPLVCVLNPGACVVAVTGAIRVCTSAYSVIRQLILAGVAYETYNCVVNGSCPVPAPTAKDLSDAHEATNRDRTKPGYGGQCTPDEYDDLANRKDQACNDANGLNCNDGKVDYGKADKILQCANARINVARKCFLGGDLGHNIQINGLMRAYGKCMGR